MWSDRARWTIQRRIGSVLLSGALTACGDDLPTGPPHVSAAAVRAAVTADLIASLDADGNFILGGPPIGVVPTVSEARARDLALAYFRTYEESLRDRYRRERWGVPLAANLTLCTRAYYAESGYDVWGPDVYPSFRRTFGDQWIISLCHAGEQQAAISVSVEIDDVVITADGTLDGNRAGNFWSQGVRRGTTVPDSPEFSAVTTSRSAGARIAALPVLRRRARGHGVFDAVWVMPMEATLLVTGVASGSDQYTAELAYGISGDGVVGTLAAHPGYAAEPREEPILAAGVSGPAFVVTRRADVPARYEVVVRKKD